MGGDSGATAPRDRPARAGRPSRTIAIDGPAASGKSTLGAALAEALGYMYFDSGAVYRALTWLALQRGVEPDDEASLADLAARMRLEVTPPAVADGRQFTVLVDGEDVTWSIRSPEVDRHVSAVSAHPRVREAVNERLRRFAAGDGLVMVGRDIGTVVLPDADLKIYLTASPEERARRRHRDFTERGRQADREAILADLRRRDEFDSGRPAAPLRPAEDAIVICSDHVSVDDEVALALEQLGTRAGAGTPDLETEGGPSGRPGGEGRDGAARSRREDGVAPDVEPAG